MNQIDPQSGTNQQTGNIQTGGTPVTTGQQPVVAQPPVVQRPVQPVASAPIQPVAAPVVAVQQSAVAQPQVRQPVVQKPVQPVASVPAPTQPVSVPVAAVQQPVVAQPPVVQTPVPVATVPVAIDLSLAKTKTGKGVTDFEIPEELIKSDPSLIDLVIRSESMNDGERQYWFNLTEIMSEEQTEKLRGILTRERTKLAEIEAKYGKPKVQLSPEEIAAKNAELEQKRVEQQRRLEEREQKYQKEEEEKEAAILAELEAL